MDVTRRVKRLAMIVLLAITVILVSKSLLSKAVKNLNTQAEKKQQANDAKLRATLPASAPILELSVTSTPADSMETVIQTAPLATEYPASTQ